MSQQRKEEPEVDDTERNWLKLSQSIFFQLALHGHHICFRQYCNLCRPVAKWNRKGVFLFALNRPLLHMPSLEASGWRRDGLGIISTLGEGN